MSPSWPIYRNIWRNAVLGERKGWLRGWTILALIVTLLAVIFVLAIGATKRSESLLLCVIPLAVLATFYWMRYVTGAVRQNSPANAHLVPGLNRNVRRTTVLTFLLTLAPMALLASASDDSVLVFVALAVIVTALGMGRGGRAAGSAIYLLMIVGSNFVQRRTGLIAWLSTPPVLAVLSLMAVALAWNALQSVFPAGGERHWKLLKGQAEQRNSTDLHKTMLLKRASGGRFRLYALLLRRDLRPAAKPEHLLLHALGPHNHRYDFVLPLAITALLAAAAWLAAAWYGVTGEQVANGRDLVACFAVPLILLQGLTFERLVVSMDNTSGEQALVRLAPRAPRANRLGRSLARQLLQICLTEWLVCAFAMLALALLFGAGREALVVLATLVSASVGMTGWALRDYSGKQPGSAFKVIAQVVVMAIGGIAVFLARDNLAAWSALLVLLLGGAFAIVYDRWKTMVGAPVQFPARRF